MAREGIVLGLFEGESLLAYSGAFIVEDFRHEGPASFCPDWCRAAAPGAKTFDAYRLLYRDLAPWAREKGALIHAGCSYSTDLEAIEALSLCGFGRIVMEAARPAAELALALAAASAEAEGTGRRGARPRLRRAATADAESLARLDSSLAAHLAASPVLMPRTRGRDAVEWAEWLGREGTAAFVAEEEGRLLGFLKAEAPQYDVSFSVHGDDTLAIDGFFVEPARRREGLGLALLGAMAAQALGSGLGLMSVDCETTNLEALAFWSRFFRPFAWGFERRTCD